MNFDGYGWGFPFAHVIVTIVSGLLSLLLILVLIGVLFLLVRFLLVATTAAKIYVARNSSPPAVRNEDRPAGPAAPPPAADPDASPTRPTDPIG